MKSTVEGNEFSSHHPRSNRKNPIILAVHTYVTSVTKLKLLSPFRFYSMLSSVSYSDMLSFFCQVIWFVIIVQTDNETIYTVISSAKPSALKTLLTVIFMHGGIGGMNGPDKC